MQSSVTIAQFPDHSRLGPGIDMYGEAMTKAGVAVHRHHMYPPLHGGEPRLSARWLWRHRGKIQVLHFHYFQRLYQSNRPYKSFFKYIGFTGKILLARLLGYHLTWTASNLYPHEPGIWLFDWFARWLVTYKAPVVFVELASAQEAVQKEFPWIHHIEEVTHGHYIGYYPPGKSMSEARREFNIPDDAFVFLNFGLIRAYKGVEGLIETFIHHFAGPK
jgi:beta-1,4-mannosyltransferase